MMIETFEMQKQFETPLTADEQPPNNEMPAEVEAENASSEAGIFEIIDAILGVERTELP